VLIEIAASAVVCNICQITFILSNHYLDYILEKFFDDVSLVSSLVSSSSQRRHYHCDMGWGAKAPTPKYISDFAFAFQIKSICYQRQSDFAFAFEISK
jgi:hypothetical protein